MQEKKTKKHIVRWILLALFVGMLVMACVFSHFGGFGTGKCADTEAFAKYAGKVSDISVPEQARVIGLGEATHGNIEFQQLKLEVFKVMVEKYGVRAFALEGDYGGCEVVNRYIHGGSGTAQEAVRGNHRIFVSAHNGHIEKRHEYGTSGKAMGNLLANELGEGYFAIGTDFFKARVSLPKGESHIDRSNHTFYSYNPLAKASKKCGYGMSWLDFSRIPDDSPLKQMVTGYLWMGSVGEGYSQFMAIMPMAYRVWGSPAELYDGMIFVSKAQPIVVRKDVLE